MATYKIWQVDAFATEVFKGNPAAVMPLEAWLPDDVLLKLAHENNLAETAYVIARGKGEYDLRWFTPGVEVNLCGHATLATAHILYTELGETLPSITFHTKSGPLIVRRDGTEYVMDFPAATTHQLQKDQDDLVEAATGARPSSVFRDTFMVAVFEDPQIVRDMVPNFTRIEENFKTAHDAGCLLVTAPGDEGFDYVARLFAPGIGIPEDPVTGSAHCMLAPYWAKVLGKDQVLAWQASARGGAVHCSVKGDRVELKGTAVTYLRGDVSL